MKKTLTFCFLVLKLFTNNTYGSSAEQPLTPRSLAAKNMREACYSDQPDKDILPFFKANLSALVSLDHKRASSELTEKEEVFHHAPFFDIGTEPTRKINDHHRYFKFAAFTCDKKGTGATTFKSATILGLIAAKKSASFLSTALPHAQNLSQDTMCASLYFREHIGCFHDADDKISRLSLLSLAQDSPIDSQEKIKLLDALRKAKEIKE